MIIMLIQSLGKILAVVFALVVVLNSPSFCAEKDDDLQPIGYLRADIFTPAPLNAVKRCWITAHLRNITNVPAKVEIRRSHYEDMAIHINFPQNPAAKNSDYDIWGPPKSDIIPDWDRKLVTASGFNADNKWPKWPQRDGIILFKDEGYARRVEFLPGWIKQETVPQQLVMGVSVPAYVSLPQRKPEAVQPGKPILFDDPKEVFAPCYILVPFKRFYGANTGADFPDKLPGDKESGLVADIELPNTITAGQDIDATYLIGNHGDHTVWVAQNQLVPANTSWTIKNGTKILSTIDGESLRPMKNLLPTRDPIPLNPGEYLTFRRILMAGDLPLKRDSKYMLSLQLEASWYSAAPTNADTAKNCFLSAQLEFAAK